MSMPVDLYLERGATFSKQVAFRFGQTDELAINFDLVDYEAKLVISELLPSNTEILKLDMLNQGIRINGNVANIFLTSEQTALIGVVKARWKFELHNPTNLVTMRVWEGFVWTDTGEWGMSCSRGCAGGLPGGNHLYFSDVVINAVGPAGTGAGTNPNIPPPLLVTFDMTMPFPLITLPPDTAIAEVNVEVEEAFDGVGATVSVGIPSDNEWLVPLVPGPDLTTVGVYGYHPAVETSTTTPIYLYLNSGTGSTTGKLRVQLVLS